MKLELIILCIMFCANSRNDQIPDSDLTADSNDEKLDFYNKCYDDLGCIETDSRWYDDKIRPVNLRPLERHIIKTEFLLIVQNPLAKTERNSLLYNTISPNDLSIKDAGFLNGAKTMFVIHDFTSNGYTGWIKHLASVLFNKHNYKCNLISVDWQRGAEPPFDQAISNARIVALEMGPLINKLKEHFGVDLNDLHLVGHGVGAHIAGYVGSNYKTIGKITGLDPTGPKFQGMPYQVKLNRRNAKYVEVLHTDAFDDRSQGTTEPMGHSDFILNGAYLQPGCSENSTYPNFLEIGRDSIKEGDILPGCSHKRAFKYFIETLKQEACKFVGVRCKSYEHFVKGKCVKCGKPTNSRCQIMGLPRQNALNQSLFYLSTGAEAPFCRNFNKSRQVNHLEVNCPNFLVNQYIISVTITTPGVHFGNFEFILLDSDNNISNLSLSDPHSNFRDYSSESKNTYIYYATPPKLTRIIEAKVKWNEPKKFYCVLYCKQSIGVRSVVLRKLSIGESKDSKIKLCPESRELQLENGEFSNFFPCNPHGGFKNPHQLPLCRPREEEKKRL